MNSVKLKPSREGLKVYKPETRLHLKEEGETIVLNKYWRRLIKSGDVVVVKDPEKAKGKNPQKNKQNPKSEE